MLSEGTKFRWVGRRWHLIAIFFVLTVPTGLGLRSAGGDFYSEYRIRRLIRQTYEVQRPGGGRLYGVPYGPSSEAPVDQSDLGKAQRLLLTEPNARTRHKLQALIHVASQDWAAASAALLELSRQQPDDVRVINDLGVVYLALGEKDTSYLLKALDLFETAAKLAPDSPEPQFNLVILSRKLRLTLQATMAENQFRRLEPSSPWSLELAQGKDETRSELIAELNKAVRANDIPRAEAAFARNPELFRALAMEYGTGNNDEPQELAFFIGRELKRLYGDETVMLMLTPLLSNNRAKLIVSRQHIQRGAQLYVQSNIQGSLQAYDNAAALLEGIDSVFDEYWLEVNRVDTVIRAGDFLAAREALRGLILGAKEHRLKWILAKALSIYGSNIRLSSSFSETIELLAQAEQTYVEAGAPHDAVRPLYYLAAHTHSAGDHDESLRLALRCLTLTDPNDALRIASLTWLLGSILYRHGEPARAVLFEMESLEQAARTKNPVLLAATASMLALLHESMEENALADKYLQTAEEALSKVRPGLERIRAELSINLLKGRLALNRKRFADAEAVLHSNLDVYRQLPAPLTYIHAQSLMLLARMYAETGRKDQARHEFGRAIDVAEGDDHYLRTEKLRLAFDDERRELYDSAIAFEYDNGSSEGAWTYVQRYRAKLFLEFLAQFNPDVEKRRAIDRRIVQSLVGPDTQVVEYVLLEDRLLIWLISDTRFENRSAPITRAILEPKIQEILGKLRNREDVAALSQELGKLLIEPIADLLEPNRTIAIIPDRALHGLPFAAIRQPGRPGYLIHDYAVVVSPSLTHLLATGAERPERNAIVSFGGQSDDVSGSRELTALRLLYPSVTTTSGEEVQKQAFLSAMNAAPIFHYAGHSATDAADPLRSSILLDGDRYGPNSVTAVDIARQQLMDNALVVLSSCDSSVGNSRDGVGMRGLTSAFLIGGAGSVVGSLWPVEASSTSELMIRFHRAFATSDLPVAHALRKAQLTFLESFPERSHPYYWSGFVVTGNFSALR